MRNDTSPLWEPDPGRMRASHMWRFLEQNCGERGLPMDYQSLYQWSIERPEEFWPAMLDYAGIQLSVLPDQVYKPGEEFSSGRWFPGARLNYAEQLLAHDNAHPALIFRDECGRRRELHRTELRRQVAQLANVLRQWGVKPGDRVAAVVPNCLEVVVICLAAASVGAIFSSCSADFGEAALVDRLLQIEPVVLFGCDGYHYAGKRIDCLTRLAAVFARLPSIRQLVVVPFLNDGLDTSTLPAAQHFPVLLQGEVTLDFAQLPFDHPLFIVWSSGTTGKPKGIIHGAGGTLLQHLKEHLLHTDIRPGDRLFYFTTCGWMMWNWLLGSLAAGATAVLYDGSPFYPDARVLWRLAADEQVNVFGTSPAFLMASAKAGIKPGGELQLASLRTVLSTGAPLPAESFEYVRDAVSPKVQLCSISGGTDIISCFVLGNPVLPVWHGEIQGPGLGMAVEVYDSQGQAVRDQPGELVCTRPFPSQPLGFWNDVGGKHFHEAYFAHFPDVWAHGDLAEWTQSGGMVIHGRTDAVLNPGGVRIGTAELYGPVLSVAEVIDVIAVAQRYAGGERIVLAVVLQSGMQLDAPLSARIAEAIREQASPRHVPAIILQVGEIPRTLSGKPMELAVRAVINGESVQNLAALANPAALEQFRCRPELD